MGYETTWFVDEVDKEFVCSICMMVVERPLESPCEHVFCTKCIVGWITQDTRCPVDRKALHLRNLSAPARLYRNLWGKLKVKCPLGKSKSTQETNLNFWMVPSIARVGIYKIVLQFSYNSGHCSEKFTAASNRINETSFNKPSYPFHRYNGMRFRYATGEPRFSPQRMYVQTEYDRLV